MKCTWTRGSTCRPPQICAKLPEGLLRGASMVGSAVQASMSQVMLRKNLETEGLENLLPWCLLQMHVTNTVVCADKKWSRARCPEEHFEGYILAFDWWLAASPVDVLRSIGYPLKTCLKHHHEMRNFCYLLCSVFAPRRADTLWITATRGRGGALRHRTVFHSQGLPGVGVWPLCCGSFPIRGRVLTVK